MRRLLSSLWEWALLLFVAFPLCLLLSLIWRKDKHEPDWVKD